MQDVDGRPLRADARQNRERILAAARDVFVELGAGAPLEEISRRAGTGIATLYRRVPRPPPPLRGGGGGGAAPPPRGGRRGAPEGADALPAPAPAPAPAPETRGAPAGLP